tara:strand:- start:320 stop:1066 length:747 start_codon:yes stop_codon:yes gene_type:complete
MSFQVLKFKKSNQRFVSKKSWLNSKHTFSFGDYIDKSWNNFGPIRVINEDTINPMSGFEMHSHQNMEIVTILLEGCITHTDSMNNKGEICQGHVQVMTSGKGISHSEKNEENKECKLLQIWITPNKYNLTPNYQQKQFEIQSGIQLIISQDNENTPLKISQEINLWRCTGPFYNDIMVLPEKIFQYNWIQVIEGELKISNKLKNKEQKLSKGDGLGFKVTHFDDIFFETKKDTDLLLFSFNSLRNYYS